jgi:hypothetical protein
MNQSSFALQKFTWHIGLEIIVSIFYNFHYLDNKLIAKQCNRLITELWYIESNFVWYFFYLTKSTLKTDDKGLHSSCHVTREGGWVIKLYDHQNLTWGDYATFQFALHVYLSLERFVLKINITVPTTLFLTFLSCSIVRVSYRIVRVSYHIVRVSYCYVPTVVRSNTNVTIDHS